MAPCQAGRVPTAACPSGRQPGSAWIVGGTGSIGYDPDPCRVSVDVADPAGTGRLPVGLTAEASLDSPCKVGKVVLHCDHQVFVPDPYCRKTPPKALSAFERKQCCRCGRADEHENRW